MDSFFNTVSFDTVRSSRKWNNIGLTDYQIEPLGFVLEQNTELTDLSIKNNNLRIFPSFITSLSNLKYLNLGKNQIHIIPNEINKLENLKKLSFKKNLNLIFPKFNLHGLYHLTTLNLSKCYLGNNGIKLIVDLKALERLSIENNHLDYFPDEISQLVNLTNLELGHNHIQSVPDTITNLINLTSLSLDNNSISIFPFAICSLTKLRVLDLLGNLLVELHHSMGLLNNLEYLDLSENKLIIFPVEICKCKKLDNLWMTDCQLSELPIELNQLGYLVDFHFQNNNIKSIPYELFPTIMRCTLMSGSFDCSVNYIESLPDLDYSFQHVYTNRFLSLEQCTEKNNMILKIVEPPSLLDYVLVYWKKRFLDLDIQLPEEISDRLNKLVRCSQCRKYRTTLYPMFFKSEDITKETRLCENCFLFQK